MSPTGIVTHGNLSSLTGMIRDDRNNITTIGIQIPNLNIATKALQRHAILGKLHSSSLLKQQKSRPLGLFPVVGNLLPSGGLGYESRLVLKHILARRVKST
jgi:hypothetical protein